MDWDTTRLFIKLGAWIFWIASIGFLGAYFQFRIWGWLFGSTKPSDTQSYLRKRLIIIFVISTVFLIISFLI